MPGPSATILRYYLLRLQRKPELIAMLRQVIDRRGGAGGDELLAHRLQSAGLSGATGGKVVPRCDLYAKYFSERLRDPS